MLNFQIEGAFVQGIGFFVTEGVETENGRELADGTWGYKVPTIDTIPKRLHVELFNSPALQERVLSSKGKMPMACVRYLHHIIQYEAYILHCQVFVPTDYYTIFQRIVMLIDERNYTLGVDHLEHERQDFGKLAELILVPGTERLPDAVNV